MFSHDLKDDLPCLSGMQRSFSIVMIAIVTSHFIVS
jgi:hypothetical protein